MIKNKKNIRWICCKENGHLSSECPRDPNFKLGADMKEEIKRIAKIGSDYSKLQNDPLIHTTKLLKQLSKERIIATPFSVGWLRFDDYNYDYINSTILISQSKIARMHYENDRVK